MVWGSLDFLSVDTFSSLATISSLRGKKNIAEISERSHPTKNQSLYIYKDRDTALSTEKDIRWIFEANIDFPLLVITIVKTKDIRKINVKLRDQGETTPFYFDLFKTLGHGTAVIVFRCKTYSHILDSLVQIGDICYNIYSIAAIQCPVDQKVGRISVESLLFKSLLQDEFIASSAFNVNVSIQYILKDGNQRTNRIWAARNRIESLADEIVLEVPIPIGGLQIEQFFEIGHYDIEVRIQGQIAYALELLLNRRYGLSNVESKFYRDFVLESRTTWKR